MIRDNEKVVLKAIMVTDEYGDLAPLYPYEVEEIKDDNVHIKLKDSPGIYDGRCFDILINNHVVSLSDAVELMRN